MVDRNWVWTAGPAAGSSAVRLQYGYDRGGDATFRKDLVVAALSELYRYDQLRRLTSFKRGVLSAGNDAVASPTLQQSWTLDARGNQTAATTNGATVARTFDEANQTTSVSGGSAPVYDAAGNTTAKDGRNYIYDAWGRLKRVVQGATTLASYAHDALRRRIVETSAGGTADVYFSGSEPIEERVGSFGVQNVLGVDGALVLHDTYPDIAGPAEPDWRTYSLQDANGNVVALVGAGAAAGNVVERYAYAPFGAVAVLDSAGAPRASSPYGQRQLFQGGRYDYATGLYQFGLRDYDPASGTWTERDPIGLYGGDPNLYRFVAGNPVNYVDPSGLLREPPGGWSWPAWEGAKAFGGSLWGNTFGGIVDETATVWRNTGAAGMSTTGRLYVTGGATAGTLTSVRGLSDAFSRHDAVDAHEQSWLERGLDLGTGVAAMGLATAAAFRSSAGRACASRVGVRATTPSRVHIDPFQARHDSITDRLREHMQNAVRNAELTPAQVADIMKNGRASTHWGTQIDTRFKLLVQNDPLLRGEIAVSPRRLPAGSVAPDVVDLRTKRWWDLTTTAKEFGKKLPKYESQYGEGTPLLYAEP